MRVLMLAPFYPLPITSGGHTRLARLVEELAPRHELHWMSLITPEQDGALPPLRSLASPPVLIPGRHNPDLRSKLAEALRPARWRRTCSRGIERLKRYPPDAIHMNFPELTSRIRERLQQLAFDIVQIEYTAMGRYVPLIRRFSPRSRIFLDEIDISYIALRRRVEIERDPSVRRELEGWALKMERFEKRLWRECDGILTMSAVDAQSVAAHRGHAPVWPVPNGVDTGYFAFREREPGSRRLLFLGNLLHPPNSAALRFFLQEVWPGIRRRNADLQLDVIGEPGGFREGGEDPPGVVFRGVVEDVRPLLAGACLMVVPIVSGSGTRLKVLEAFASGLPVISTPLGCEGIDIENGREVLLAETAQDFIEGSLRMADHPEDSAVLARQARQLVESRYTWNSIAGEMERVWGEVARPPAA
jgi:glycosyltransferase involved in cell wall biosynthesis